MYEWDAEALGTEPVKHDVLTPWEYYPTLKRGDKNEYVYHWQLFLNLNGYDCGVADGIFGKNTEVAVKEWQAAHGLKADGIIGPKTWDTVGKVG